MLVIDLAGHRAASPTARAQARLWAAAATPFHPVHGSFHAPMAALMTGWSEA